MVGGEAVVFVADGPGHLQDELVVQAVDDVADVILDVPQVQVLAPPDAGIEDVEKITQDLNHRLAAGQWFVAQVAGAAALGVGGNDGLGNVRQRFLEADIRGHAPTPLAHPARRTVLLSQRQTSPC